MITRQIYFDYCATTPVHPDVKRAMLPTLGELFGNPSSLHWAGQEAEKAVSLGREQVADAIAAQPEEIFFTAGATEADNLALIGVMRAISPHKNHLITSSIEHHAILHTAEFLETEGFRVTFLPVNSKGLVDPDDLRAAILPETALISIMMVNNEVGVIQSIDEIARIAREHEVLFHTDAVQGIGLFDIDVGRLGVDLLSLSAHKIYGPKGIGALFVRESILLHPIVYGGPQENKLRPGTENIPGIVGLGAALKLVNEHKTEEREKLNKLRKYFIDRIREMIPTVIINGSSDQVAPHVISTSFKGSDSEMMLFHLNKRGIAVSMGSACTADSIEPSHVLTAMNLPKDLIEGTLRISIGYPTTIDEVDCLLEVLPDVVKLTKIE